MDLKDNVTTALAVLIGTLFGLWLWTLDYIFYLIGGALLYRYLSHVERDLPESVIRAQSIASNTRNPGESAIYRWPGTPHGSKLHDTIGDAKTGYTAFWNIAEKLPNSEYIGRALDQGGFEWMTRKQVSDAVLALGSAIIAKAPVKGVALKGADPSPAQLVGILCKNCPEWLILDHALFSFGLVSVPMHESFDPPALEYILGHTEMPVVGVSLARLDSIIAALPKAPKLKMIILLDAEVIPPSAITKAGSVKIQTYAEMVSYGRSNLKNRMVPEADDVLTICYTSGTTGNPKGVLMTHRNVIAASAGVLARIPDHLAFGPEDRHLSFLPLSHMLERDVCYTLGALGAKIGFYRGDVTKLMDDIAELKPTVFPCVPRLLNRIYDKIVSTVDGGSAVTRNVFWFAFNQKKALLEQGKISRSTIWDKIVFKKVQAKLGGSLKFMLSGAAPIDPQRLIFFRVVFGCDVVEGYGQTECAAATAITNCGDYLAPNGPHVGVPLASSEIKLVDVPEMGYRSDDPNPRGEICVRGPSVMKGYYKEPAKTKEAIDAQGWLHTGDVGEIVANGTLKIVDRIKNIYKLSQGEFVAPETLESKLTNKFAVQMYIHGDSMKEYLVAVIAPEMDVVKKWAGENGITHSKDEDYRVDEKVILRIMEELKALGKSAGLKGYEIPRKIVLTEKLMSVENGLLTPTFKAKRHLVKNFFNEEIKALYA